MTICLLFVASSKPHSGAMAAAAEEFPRLEAWTGEGEIGLRAAMVGRSLRQFPRSERMRLLLQVGPGLLLGYVHCLQIPEEILRGADSLADRTFAISFDFSFPLTNYDTRIGASGRHVRG